MEKDIMIRDYHEIIQELSSYDEQTIIDILSALTDTQILLSESNCEHSDCEYAIAHSQKIFILLLSAIHKSEYNSTVVQK